MTKINNTILILIALFFISCGEVTKTSQLIDISSIAIDNKNISIYSTDANISDSATVTYNDNSTAIVTDDVSWSDSNNTIFSVTQGKISISTNNGGDANLSINYKKFNDSTLVHVNKLTSFNLVYPDVNSSGTGSYTFSAKGNFDNNQTDRLIKSNIFWTANNGAVISIFDGVATITFLTGDTNVTATMFGDTNESSPIAPITVNFKLN